MSSEYAEYIDQQRKADRNTAAPTKGAGTGEPTTNWELMQLNRPSTPPDVTRDAHGHIYPKSDFEVL
jgi:hypothetical protein